jgi:hypothetical protein
VLPLAIKLSCSEDVAQTHHPIQAEVNWGFFFNAKTLSQQQEESELLTSLQIEFTWRICCWLSKEWENTKMDMLASTEVSVRSLCTCDRIAATCLPAWILLLSRLTSCNPCYTHAPNSYLLVIRLSPCNIKISLRGAMIPCHQPETGLSNWDNDTQYLWDCRETLQQQHFEGRIHQEWAQTSAYEHHPQSVRPSPSSWIAVWSSCHDILHQKFLSCFWKQYEDSSMELATTKET